MYLRVGNVDKTERYGEVMVVVVAVRRRGIALVDQGSVKEALSQVWVKNTCDPHRVAARQAGKYRCLHRKDSAPVRHQADMIKLRKKRRGK